MAKVARRLFTALVARRTHFFIGGAVVLVSIGAVIVSYAEHSQYAERVRAQSVSDVSDVRATLESALANRLVLPDALASLAVAHRGDVAEEFEDFAEGLVESHRSYLGQSGNDPAVRSVQLAPDAVVTYVYPIEGNEQAIGHDLLADPVRGPAVRRAINERRFVLAGPFELLQGGSGLVGRSPIYFDGEVEDEFWGFATVVLNFDEVARDAGLTSVERGGLTYALRGRDGTGATGEVFWGSEEVFDHDPVTLDVLVPNGSWQIAAHPSGGWPMFPFRLASIVILVIGLLLSLLVAVVVWRWERERRTVVRVSDNLTRLVDSTTSAIIAVDGAGRIAEWNRAMVELTGLDKGEAAARTFDELCVDICHTGSDSTAVKQAIAAVLSGDEESVDALVNVGTPPRRVAFFVTPRTGVDGEQGVVLVGHDITTRLEAERMRAENVALARSARLKDEFLAGMSHELRTPLNAIIGLSSVLNRRTFGDLTDKQSQYVEQIGTSGQHLLGLINDVLDLAKLDAEKVELDVEACEVAGIVNEAVDLIRPLAAQRGVAVEDPSSIGHHVVTADRRRLLQVLVNLVSNAVKFTERGGTMGVEVETCPDHVAITVWDTGVGIESDHQGYLFEPFLQVDGSLSREQEGTGLGLAIAAKLVALHDGSISVESRPGHGSRFTVELPLTGPIFREDSAVGPMPIATGS